MRNEALFTGDTLIDRDLLEDINKLLMLQEEITFCH